MKRILLSLLFFALLPFCMQAQQKNPVRIFANAGFIVTKFNAHHRGHEEAKLGI
jgi:hypothetical protein